MIKTYWFVWFVFIFALKNKILFVKILIEIKLLNKLVKKMNEKIN